MPRGIANNPEEKSRKISEKKLGKKRKPFSLEWRKKLGDFNRGKKLSPRTDEVKKKISEKLLGRFIGNKNPNYGKRHSKEVRAIISLKTIEKTPRGERSHFWKGGVTPYCRMVRTARLRLAGGSHTTEEWQILQAQYNWTCPACKKQEPSIRLTKDHIIPVSKEHIFILIIQKIY